MTFLKHSALRATMRLSVLAVVAALTFGCANQRTTDTGFLPRASYHSFYIKRVDFVPGPKSPKRPNEVTVNRLKSVYRKALVHSFSDRLQLADGPGPGVIEVRAAITGYEPANVWLNVVTSTLIGPVTAGGASTEAELLDSVTGTRVASLSTHSNGTPFLGGPQNYFKRYGHARSALRHHAKGLGKRLGPVTGVKGE